MSLERCAACGDCMLATTGGISPIARCSKSFMNGPCGGTHDGRCEIKRDTDCAWVLIVERMKRLGRQERIRSGKGFICGMGSADRGLPQR